MNNAPPKLTQSKSASESRRPRHSTLGTADEHRRAPPAMTGQATRPSRASCVTPPGKSLPTTTPPSICSADGATPSADTTQPGTGGPGARRPRRIGCSCRASGCSVPSGAPCRPVRHSPPAVTCPSTRTATSLTRSVRMPLPESAAARLNAPQLRMTAPRPAALNAACSSSVIEARQEFRSSRCRCRLTSSGTGRCTSTSLR
jgi:hypothetical protein